MRRRLQNLLSKRSKAEMSTLPPTNPVLVTVCAAALSETVQKLVDKETEADSIMPKNHICIMFFLVASEEEAPQGMRAGDPEAEMAFLAPKILGQMTLLTPQMKTPGEGTMVLGAEVEVL